jgi:hypothetical protein
MSEPTQTVTFAPPEIPIRPLTKWEREHGAFRRLLPELLLSERGKYVAIHEEQLVDSDSGEKALFVRVIGRIGNVDFHLGLVSEEPERIFRSGVGRELPRPVVSFSAWPTKI